MEKRTALYAGTFDPLTVGHLWVIERGARLFDRLIVAIGINTEKRCMFSPQERLDMLVESTKQFPNVSADIFAKKYQADFARVHGAQFILRGIRKIGDYEYERDMRDENETYGPEITTILVMPPLDLIRVSSTFVKGLVGFDGWEAKVRRHVTEPVFKKIQEAHHAKSA